MHEYEYFWIAADRFFEGPERKNGFGGAKLVHVVQPFDGPDSQGSAMLIFEIEIKDED